MNSITIVLRSGMGMQIDSVRPYLRNGMPIAIGRAGAVISHFADGDAHLALRTIAEFPCPEQDDLPAANMRQIALAALSGAGASSEPGNPGGEPLSGPGSAGERPYPAPGLARERDPLGLARHAQTFNEAPAQGLKPSAFDPITGTTDQPQEAAQDLPPLEEHLAQVEQEAALCARTRGSAPGNGGRAPRQRGRNGRLSR
ncbi:hypothetical protein [Pseudomonas phage vB_Pae_CF34a]|nr:hypothetical protein [Pseudomonas phage vB_Pae_CF34a]